MNIWFNFDNFFSEQKSEGEHKMKSSSLTAVILAVICLGLLVASPGVESKKSKKKKTKKSELEKGFDSQTLKCLVCRSIVEEFEAAIYKVSDNIMMS